MDAKSAAIYAGASQFLSYCLANSLGESIPRKAHLALFDDAGRPPEPLTVLVLAKLFERVARITLCSNEVTILAVIFVARVVRQHRFQPRHARRLIFSALHLAHKTHEDRAIATADWVTVWQFATKTSSSSSSSRTAAEAFTVSTVIALEGGLLDLLSFRTYVSRAVFTALSFDLRDFSGAAARDSARRLSFVEEPHKERQPRLSRSSSLPRLSRG